MPPVKIEDTLAYYGLNSNVLSGQSILDIFVLQGIIELADADKLKRNFKTNRETENFLLQNGIVSKETINKAYSILLKIPFISLRKVQVSGEVLALIPEKMAQKYGVVPFALDENVLRIALFRPADLLAGFQGGLSRVLEVTGREVELFITNEEDFLEVLSQYNPKKDDGIKLSKGAYPVIYLRNQAIPAEYLKKLPRDFIAKNRMVVFDSNKSGNLLIASEKPESVSTIKMIAFLKKENNINIELFATSSGDIDYALDLYDGKAIAELKPELEAMPKAIEPAKESSEPAVIQDKSSGKAISFNNFWTPSASADDDALTIDSVTSDEMPQITTMDDSTKQALGFVSPSESTVKSEQAPPEPIVLTKKVEVNAEPVNVEKNAEEAEPQIADEASADKDIGSLIPGEISDISMLESIVQEGYIPKIVAAIINYAINSRASDIHIEPETKILRVRCRIDGILRDVVKMPLSLHPPFISRLKILAKLKIDESRIPQDGRFDVSFERRSVDVRISTLPTVHGEKAVLRILDKSQGTLSLEDLGMQGSAFEQTIGAISKPHGIILSTGPTGSGKSTTLYAIMSRISVPGINIVTLEDPVEYEIPGINQCQVKPDIGFTFASGLRSVLRQDPNVIMVGEIRDSETANMATHAALTGHLVLSTLHTNDAGSAMPRLTNMGVEPFLITSSINLIIAQRLVRRICPKCKEELKVPQKLYDEMMAEVQQISPKNTIDRERLKETKLYYGRGCSECSQGYKGRIGIFEVLQVTPEIEDLAVARRPASEIKEAAIKGGMITMKQDGILKVFQGLTTIDEVMQVVVSS